MKTEQINIRLEGDLLAALERVAREESLERGDVIRRLLERSIERWELDRAVRGYQNGVLSLGRAAEEAGITQWDLLDATRSSGVAYPLTGQDVDDRVSELFSHGFRTSLDWRGETIETLADIRPRPGGTLLVGINSAPVSVAAGHYYQGRIGKRLWRRLEALGLLIRPEPGSEDEAFARSGHGLTDLVKRPTTSSREVPADEFDYGIQAIGRKIDEWRPGLILFAFAESARRLLEDRELRPGRGPTFRGVPTFLLSGPYAPARETERINKEFRDLFLERQPSAAAGDERTQRLTANDIRTGQIRIPRAGKRFFPPNREEVEIILRGRRVVAKYDPRTGPDRQRSAVLRVGRVIDEVAEENEQLIISRGLAGVVNLT